MSFVSTDPSNHQGENTWFTPPEIIQELGGKFDLDPCTVSYRPFDTAKMHFEHDRGECGLQLDWHPDWEVWMNPPYGKEIAPFIKKFKQHNNGIALVFARMGTPWMQEWVADGLGIFFLRKRVRFINKKGIPGTNAGADSCLLYCGKSSRNRILMSELQGVFCINN